MRSIVTSYAVFGPIVVCALAACSGGVGGPGGEELAKSTSALVIPKCQYGWHVECSGDGPQSQDLCVCVQNPPGVTFTGLANTPGQPANAMWLMQDGTVLALLGDGRTLSRLTPDTSGSYATGLWSPAGSLQYSRFAFASQVLSNGKLVICGGEYSSAGNETNTCEIYDPLAPIAQATSTMASPTFLPNVGDAPSVLLPNGQMMLEDYHYGSQQGEAALLDLATMTWSQHSGDGIDAEQGWTLLQTGDVLTAALLPNTLGGTTSASKRYSPGSAGFVSDGTIPVVLGANAEIGPSMALASGKVIWFGASGHTAIYTPTVAGQNGTWVQGPDIPLDQNKSQLVSSDAWAVLEPTGRVLVEVSNSAGSQLAEYDPGYNAFLLLGTNGPTNFNTEQSPLLLLPNGHGLMSVLGSSSWAYLDLKFTGTTLSFAPTITSYPTTPVTRGSTVTLGGTQFCGLSEVSMMGDDNQQAENYPMVRATGGGITTYLRAHDVSTRSIAPNQAATVSVDMWLTPGPYSLQVVAMGIASSPVSVQVAP